MEISGTPIAPPSALRSMATLAPTRKARPMVWRMRTNGNAQIVVDSRSQTLGADVSIERKNGSMREACYPHKCVRRPARPQKGRTGNSFELGFGIWDLGFPKKVESAEPRRLRQFR